MVGLASVQGYLRLFISFSLSPFLPFVLVSRRGFSHPTPRRSSHLPSPERIWCLLTGSSPPSRFPRRYASFGAMTVGTNSLTCGFPYRCSGRPQNFSKPCSTGERTDRQGVYYPVFHQNYEYSIFLENVRT